MSDLPPPVPPSLDPPIDRAQIRPSLLWLIVPGVLTAAGLVLNIAIGVVGVVSVDSGRIDGDLEFLLNGLGSLVAWIVTLLAGGAVALIIALRHRSARALADAARAERLARERGGLG